MLRNYLLIALRNFRRQKVFSLLNIFGLALGLASAILIFLYVSDELRYDTLHPFYKDTYRIGSVFTNPDGQRFENTVSPGQFMRYLKDNRPEVLYTCRIDNVGYPTSLDYKPTDKIVLTEKIVWAEPGFDKILLFKLITGDKQTLFKDFNTILLSETGARNLFGNADPMGKVISLKHIFATQGKEINVQVAGIYKDYPANSHFKPDYIININALHSIYGDHYMDYLEGSRFSQYTSFFENYVVLKPGASIKPINAVLNTLANQMLKASAGVAPDGSKFEATSIKLADMHFDPKNLWEDNSNTHGDRVYLAIFGIIAIMVMVIACINYTNLATARSVKRAKEVGLRKSFGGSRFELAIQFFLESFLMTLCALIMSVLLVLLFLHPFNQVAHKSFSIASLADPYMLTIVGAIVLFMTVVAGFYPAIYLSAFQPVKVLKGQLVKGKGAEFLRKTLVTIQYSVSLGLVVYTLIVIQQMDQLRTTKLNEHGSQLLAIRFGGIAQQDHFEIFRRTVLEDPQIPHVTMGNHLPRLDYFGFIGRTFKFPSLDNKDLQWNQLSVDYDFPKTFQLQFLAGRDFQYGNGNDSTALILNEAAVHALNKPLGDVMGAIVRDTRDTNRLFRVIGVVKDFPFRSMHQPIEPLVLSARPDPIDKIAYIKLPPGSFQEKIAAIEKKWKAAFPGAGFDHWFVSDEFNRMYQVERTISSLAKVFAVLAILITVLGVLSLASYTAEQRTKEIGIRKVLGAGDKQVVALFAAIFLKIFVVASLIAIPVSWYLAEKWLQGFVYRVAISPLIFVFSLTGLLLVTGLTIGYEIWRSVRANPVTALRTE
ncbi:MAG TPA: FtsX-like permease family protein [Puia sp.]|uniref:ABC transporter permease n=1 Tax=Puia sp. TaxID=2045100 RepID=UPI002B62CB78|nr:FtsX-like permease family protein [Puia sp.]HVU98420.1 FtsX-like permease family protein [Puia sp.]